MFILLSCHNVPQCTETFQKVIDLAPESQDATEAKEMQGKTQYAIQASMSAPADPEQQARPAVFPQRARASLHRLGQPKPFLKPFPPQARAMEDPEIAAILSDPLIRNFLNDMQGGGKAAEQAQKTMQVRPRGCAATPRELSPLCHVLSAEA